ncbi:hypothetical protein OU995_08450 [Roseateles sp. SL47]|jgi:hypothetical protein|uniref:hypothetical protein n=1 Tax=Roseateles sp. SL47 TaxID=2995138 RepID=UPI002272224F|nr:hypothetical protein [Roseateles sp. SL47]WAC74716.1 hypothetical protein OU995_08450 [Roseateles sp. SL47]
MRNIRPAMQAPRKTELARQLLAPGQRQLAPALRALLITVDGKRDASELCRLGRGLGLGENSVQLLQEKGLIELPAPLEAPRSPQRAQEMALAAQAAERAQAAKRLVNARFFALDLVTRMLAGREADLRNRSREADTHSRFMEWVDLCCERIEEHSDASRAAMFRERVEAAMRG